MKISMLTLIFCLFTVMSPAQAGLGDFFDKIDDFNAKIGRETRVCNKNDSTDSCNKKMKRNLDAHERTKQKSNAKITRLEENFIKEYIKLDGYKTDKRNLYREVQSLTDRMVFLELKRDTRSLTKTEERELTRLPSQIKSVDRKITTLEKRMTQSGLKLAKYEADYKYAGGRANLKNVANQRIRQANRY